jgi:hypothetical protein
MVLSGAELVNLSPYVHDWIFREWSSDERDWW